MPPPRKITNYFKRPAFASAAIGTRSKSPGEDPAPQSSPQSSPLTELSSQLLPSLLRAAGDEPADNDPAPQSSFQSAETGTSFNSAQRMMKNGKEVVISSDGDESDSAGSLESPDDLLARFLTPKSPVTTKERAGDDNETTQPDRKNPKHNSVVRTESAPRKYKNSLENLVRQAVSDNETEVGIAKLRASLNDESDRNTDSGPDKASNLNEGVLASAIDDGNDDSMGLQRLLDAVRRTEAFDLGKSWSFFDLQTPLPPGPDFPRECVSPRTYLGVLREPDSRVRAFYSGIIDFALSRELLPDELVKWIFHSIPSEPRDSLRHAYGRALKRIPAERMRALIRPSDVDVLFWQLSARPEALATSEAVVPDAHPNSNASDSQAQHHIALISVLNVFRDSAKLFAGDTRNHILGILLRLPLDASLTRNTVICSEIERTITAVLDAVTDDSADELATNVCDNLYATLKDAELQSRLLEHIAPVNDWIATLRRRLAYIFLTGDPLVDAGSQDRTAEIKRIINILKDPRYDVKRYKRKDQPEYDYGALRAITTFLNIIIDSGWSETQFPDKGAEDEFNNEVDVLADRIKKVFTAIEDSGASHLKRTLAKEALETLHYRVVYSVRTKPRPKKTYFGEYESQQKTQNILKFVKKKEVVILSDKSGS
ncbi:uncharacterized protein APUU_10407S [Aspergillus puulaauensis]|uniref:Uncharacterized protein n=1 Tax=Aspergillus puulaauensis TaxID=1220207 RepID=A0A7R7XBC0_9EURO|nr:uncharacterized protein APUU_10407S [Aspergillus puulaauensis]BCS17579.1 hypothetical protein APUU_10407S [Aspergillus puulaauensis]